MRKVALASALEAILVTSTSQMGLERGLYSLVFSENLSDRGELTEQDIRNAVEKLPPRKRAVIRHANRKVHSEGRRSFGTGRTGGNDA